MFVILRRLRMLCTHWTTVAVRSLMFVFWLCVLLVFVGFSHVIQLFKGSRSINVFTWPMLIDNTCLQAFERETGIKVNVSYYETNEELFSKLKATGGTGYDIIIPSDYIVQALVDDGLIKRIDTTKIRFWHELDGKLLDLYFDRGNKYTLPYLWAVYGLGIDTRFFNNNGNGPVPEASWGLIFDKNKVSWTVGMPESAREAVLLACFYLFGAQDEIGSEHIRAIQKVLSEQRAWVEAYTESGAENLLLSQSCPVVVATGPDVLRIKKTHPYIDFIVPREGGFVVIDSFALAGKSTKDDLAYEFINYLYRADVLERHRELYGMCPPIRRLQKSENEQFCPPDTQFARMAFFRAKIPEKVLNEIWIELMADAHDTGGSC